MLVAGLALASVVPSDGLELVLHLDSETGKLESLPAQPQGRRMMVGEGAGGYQPVEKGDRHLAERCFR